MRALSALFAALIGLFLVTGGAHAETFGAEPYTPDALTVPVENYTGWTDHTDGRPVGPAPRVSASGSAGAVSALAVGAVMAVGVATLIGDAGGADALVDLVAAAFHHDAVGLALAAAPVARIRELRTKRAGLATEAQGILNKAKEEKRDGLTAEEQQRFDAIHTEVEALKTQIDNEERQMDLQAEMDAPQEVRSRTAAGDIESREISGDEAQAAEKRYSEAFGRHLRGRATSDDRALLAERFEQLTPEQRALSVGTDTAGGYTVPEGFYNRIVEKMKRFGGIRQSGVTIMSTASGNKIPIPTSDDTSNEGELLAENAAAGEQDVTFGQETLGAYMFSSKLIRVSIQLMQDSAFDLEAFLEDIISKRLGRITSRLFTTGTGSGQPKGLVTAATVGKVAGSGQATSVTYGDLVDLEHSVDPDYRGMPGTGFQFHDTTLRALKKLEDADGRPLWVPGIALREPDTILSYGYTINQNMPVMAAGAKSIVFGDMGEYVIRDVLGMQLVIFREKYMNQLQVGFLGFSRHDGTLLDTTAVKYFQNTPS